MAGYYPFSNINPKYQEFILQAHYNQIVVAYNQVYYLISQIFYGTFFENSVSADSKSNIVLPGPKPDDNPGAGNIEPKMNHTLDELLMTRA